jgi:hypothetical protein
LFLYSDGGALKHIGLIGWVIATETELLWDCTGTAFGWHAKTTLFDPKALAISRAMLVFLQAFIRFYQIQPATQPSPSRRYSSSTALTLASSGYGRIAHKL